MYRNILEFFCKSINSCDFAIKLVGKRKESVTLGGSGAENEVTCVQDTEDSGC